MQKNIKKAARMLGSSGGKKRRDKYGKESMSAMQSAGGKAIRKKKGLEYFRELNRRSHLSKQAKKMAKNMPVLVRGIETEEIEEKE